jgi:hypothetical protein
MKGEVGMETCVSDGRRERPGGRMKWRPEKWLTPRLIAWNGIQLSGVSLTPMLAPTVPESETTQLTLSS